MAVKLQLRRGTSTDWAASTELLAEGEIVFATDTKQFRVGDGTKTWAQLNDISGPKGNAGAAGVGIPTGGSVGNIIVRAPGADYTTSWTSNYVTTVNGTSGAITGLATAASPTFSGVATISGTLKFGSTFYNKVPTIDSLGVVVPGYSVSSLGTAATLAVRGGNGDLTATTLIGQLLQLAPSSGGYTSTLYPSLSTLTGGNHAFYLPQIPSPPYSATLISSADVGTVTSNLIQGGSVTETKIADNSITTNKIVNGTITNEDINAAAGIAVTKLSASSITVNGSAITLGGTGTITAAPVAGTVTDASIVYTGLSPEKIAGTAVIASDGRLTNTRTPTAGSVVNASIVSGGLSPSVITGTAVTLSGQNVFSAGNNYVPVTIKGFNGGTSNLQEWFLTTASLSAAVWINLSGKLVATSGANVGTVPTLNTSLFGALTIHPTTSSEKGLVIRQAASGTGNAIEVQDSTVDSTAVFLMDSAGTIKSSTPLRNALVVADSGTVSTINNISGALYAAGLITLTCTANVLGSTGTPINLSGFANSDFAFLNNTTGIMTYSGAGASFTIPYTNVPTASITAALGNNTTTVTYTADNIFEIGQRVTITGLPTTTGSSLNFANVLVTSPLDSSQFSVTVTSATTGTAASDVIGNVIGSVIRVFTSATNLTSTTGSIAAQTAYIQRWQAGGTPSVTAVDAIGNLFSTKLYTKRLASLTDATGLKGYNAIKDSTTGIDIIGTSMGLYDTAGRNQIFGATTVGYAVASSVAGAPSGQYGILQVFRNTGGASAASAVLTARLNSGTGWLQSWMLGTSSKARIEHTGNIVSAGSLTMSGSLQGTYGNFTSTTLASVFGSTISVYGNGPSSIDDNLYIGNTSQIKGTGFPITMKSTSGNITALGIASLPYITSDITSVFSSSQKLSIPSYTSFNLGSSASFNILFATGSEPYHVDIRARVYACDSSFNLIEEDWVEGTITSTTVGYSPSVGSTFTAPAGAIKGFKAGSTFNAAIGTDYLYLKLVPISNYSTGEVRTTKSVSVGAEGTKLKRVWNGVKTVTFSSGTGTLSYGYTLPVTPSSVNFVAKSNSLIQLTLQDTTGVISTTGVLLNSWTAGSATTGNVEIYWTAVE